MIEKTCNIWIESADFRCIPTIGATTAEGLAYLDAGVAREAALRFAGLEEELGRMLAARGNHVHQIRPGLLSFPVKQYRWSSPSIQIIERSARELAAVVGSAKTLLPRPGCGPGELPWEDVAKALAFLPDNVVVIVHA